MAQEIRSSGSIPPDRLGFTSDTDHERPTPKRRFRALRVVLCWTFGMTIGSGLYYYARHVRPTLGAVAMRYDVFVAIALSTLLVSLSLHILALHSER